MLKSFFIGAPSSKDEYPPLTVGTRQRASAVFKGNDPEFYMEIGVFNLTELGQFKSVDSSEASEKEVFEVGKMEEKEPRKLAPRRFKEKKGEARE